MRTRDLIAQALVARDEVTFITKIFEAENNHQKRRGSIPAEDARLDLTEKGLAFPIPADGEKDDIVVKYNRTIMYDGSEHLADVIAIIPYGETFWKQYTVASCSELSVKVPPRITLAKSVSLMYVGPNDRASMNFLKPTQKLS